MVITKDKSFYKSLILLALPIALQNLITFGVGFADNVMIASLGDTAVSGVYFGNQIQTLLQLISGGIEGAILVLGAQYLGRDDKQSIRRIGSIGFRISAILGALLTLVCTIFPEWVISLFTNDSKIIDTGADYLFIVAFSYVFFCMTQALIAMSRSAENPRIGLYVSAVSLIINVSLNYLFIFGKFGLPSLGVRGAAIATLISRVCEFIIILIYTLFVEKKLKFTPRDFFGFDRTLFVDFLRYGAPIIAGQIVWATNMLAASAIMGRQPEDGVAVALSIANTMHNLAYVTMNGMAGAVGIITGKTIGAGNYEKMKEYAKTTQFIFIILGLVTGGAVQLLKSPFISMYSDISPAAVAQSRALINVISVTIIGSCYQVACLFGLVKSGGDIGFVFRMDLIFVFLVVLPAGLIATRLGAPAWFVFGCLKCDQIFKCIVAAVKINRFRWMKNLTRGNNATNGA